MAIHPLICVVARLVLAIVFAHAAATKLRDPGRFAAALAGYRLLPDRLIGPIAWTLPALEALAALLLLAPGAEWAGAGLTLALLAVVTGAVIVNLARGRREIDCGCGGAEGQHLSGGLVARNLVLALCLLPAAGAAGWPALDGVGAVTAPLAAALFASLYFAASQLLANAGALAVRRKG